MQLIILNPSLLSSENMRMNTEEIAKQQPETKAYFSTSKLVYGNRDLKLEIGFASKSQVATTNPTPITWLLGTNTYLLDENTKWNGRRLIVSKPGSFEESD
ncbi:hypothetical protein scyTo_0003036 [Scyliorhinus torazame]|uniref:Uncharacterized protein n=1 Tax=Scyliorhinus torazame TaxID=75743 RepID=A0A401PLH1_SCYTO|nr:hypothetical protein [Scyliorhinus torazame]